MTFDELESALWNARAVLRLNGSKTPVMHGTVDADMLAALKEHRDEIVHRLRGLGGARLEGLVCGVCDPGAVTGSPTGYRGCPTHGGQLHYARVS